jgi:hypothetical protein
MSGVGPTKADETYDIMDAGPILNAHPQFLTHSINTQELEADENHDVATDHQAFPRSSDDREHSRTHMNISYMAGAGPTKAHNSRIMNLPRADILWGKSNGCNIVIEPQATF